MSITIHVKSIETKNKFSDIIKCLLVVKDQSFLEFLIVNEEDFIYILDICETSEHNCTARPASTQPNNLQIYAL